MFLVVKHIGTRDLGVNVDGSTCENLGLTDVMTKREALVLANKVGGRVVNEADIFSQDYQESESEDLYDVSA